MNLLSKMNLPVTRILGSALPTFIALTAMTANSFAVTIKGTITKTDSTGSRTSQVYNDSLSNPNVRSDFYKIDGSGANINIEFAAGFSGLAAWRNSAFQTVDYLSSTNGSRSYVLPANQIGYLEVWGDSSGSPAYSFKITNQNAIVQVTSIYTDMSVVPLTLWPDASTPTATPTPTPTPAVTPTASTKPGQRIVLLLHGLQDTPERCWSNFMKARDGSEMGLISGGVILKQATPDDSNVLYYAVDFGAYDKDPSARRGLDDKTNIPATATVASADVLKNSGDFELFDDPKGLTGEVKDAISRLLKEFPGGVEVALVGHSRGGLVARAFLQNAKMNGPEKSSVRAMLTIGSPNKGCPVARLYSYAASTSPQSDYNTWKIGAYIKSKGLDTLRPTASDLIPESPVITNLNHPNNLKNLPVTVVYGTLAYTSVDMGFLRLGYMSYSLMPGAADFFTNPADNISDAAAKMILGNQTASSLSGDGMVSASQQGYRDLLDKNSKAFANFACFTVIDSSKTVVHTEEPYQEADITDALNKMIPWWGDDFNGLNTLRYIASYPDLIKTFGIDTARAEKHYVTSGYYEKRKATFDVLQYIASYPDLIKTFRLRKIAATKHYILKGYNAGLRATFNANRYLAKYPDLRKAFGTNTIAATRHYILTGYAEGRTDK